MGRKRCDAFPSTIREQREQMIQNQVVLNLKNNHKPRGNFLHIINLTVLVMQQLN